MSRVENHRQFTSSKMCRPVFSFALMYPLGCSEFITP